MRNPKQAAARMRVGIVLFVLSWLPFPLLALAILRVAGFLQSDKAGSEFVVIMWGLQYLIGFIGLWMAGRESITLVRRKGWRKLPSLCWQALRTGQVTE